MTQNIAHEKRVSDEVMFRTNTLLNAQWKDGAEAPLDEKPEWVWLTDGLFAKLEKEAWYNLKE